MNLYAIGYAIGLFIAFIISLIILFQFVRMAFIGKVPQSPAALGAGIVAISFILAVSLFVILYIEQSLLNILGLRFNLYLYFSIPLLIGTLVLGGFLAAKTSEDTVGMNIKLLLAIGVVPHFLVTTIAFLKLPGWVNYIDLGIYIPAIIVGKVLYLKMPNKAFDSLGSSTRRPQGDSN